MAPLQVVRSFRKASRAVFCNAHHGAHAETLEIRHPAVSCKLANVQQFLDWQRKTGGTNSWGLLDVASSRVRPQ